jgi:succinate dehydrogenase / fumarate reductase, membrane anchor subunit
MMTLQTGAAPRGRTGSKFEVYMWFFTRVTGILFLLMGAFNLIYANLAGGQGNMDVGAQMRWAFFPISFHVENTSVEVTPNFWNPFWQAYSLLLVTFAATHGYNGLRVILTDYVRSPLLLAWLKALLFGLWVFTLVAAAFIIFVFTG